MMAYAEKTEIALEKSISEIIGMVRRAGAQQIGQMEDIGWFAIQFNIHDRLIRFRVTFPSIDKMPTHNGRREALSIEQRQKHLEQRKRSLGRALMLVIKAKLESVESGIETIEQAFLANVVMANGETVYDRVSQRIALEYQSGTPIPALGLLPAPGAAQ